MREITAERRNAFAQRTALVRPRRLLVIRDDEGRELLVVPAPRLAGLEQVRVTQNR